MRQTVSFLFLLLANVVAAQPNQVKITHDEAARRVSVTVDDNPFTAYSYPGPDVLKKPVLYPIRTAGGNFITRGWPLDPRPGERVDHPHHVGMWFNYGDVNGHDFWNNSTAVGPEHKGPFGTIVHTGVKSMKSGKGQGELVVTANWLDKDGTPMLEETTTYHFGATADSRTIDRMTTLTALNKDVVFNDNKEGLDCHSDGPATGAAESKTRGIYRCAGRSHQCTRHEQRGRNGPLPQQRRH